MFGKMHKKTFVVTIQVNRRLFKIIFAFLPIPDSKTFSVALTISSIFSGVTFQLRFTVPMFIVAGCLLRIQLNFVIYLYMLSQVLRKLRAFHCCLIMSMLLHVL